MADLDVQPKKKSILPWILLALGILALLFFLFRGCGQTDDAAAAGSDTVSAAAPADTTTTAAAGNDWKDVDFNAPATTYPEVKDTNILVRGTSNYGIYGLGENILFDVDKSTIKTSAEQNLKEVAASIAQRFKNADVRVYGYTDAVGSAGYNKELAEQRATAVREWLTKNGNIATDKISMEPVGEANPVATNASGEGRRLNRRVEIVARTTGNGGGDSGQQ